MDRRFPFLDAPRPLAFAHRGGAGAGDENTAEAFTRAIALGYRYLETDVRATRDGVPVLLHDHTLDRMTGHRGRVAELTWRDLSTVRVAGSSAVPRLDEVLAAWPRVRFNLEVKADDAVVPTTEAVTRGATAGQVLLASFSDARLAQLRQRVGPQIPTSLGRRGVARLRLASLANRPVPLPPSTVAVQVPQWAYGIPVVDARLVRHAHRLGLQVHVWTVDNPGHMHRLLDLGVDGIMTDRLEMLREVYLRRGIWHAD